MNRFFWTLTIASVVVNMGILDAAASPNRSSGDANKVTAEVRSQIQNAYDGFAGACLRHDTDRMMSYLSPDVVWHQLDGTVPHRDEIRKSMDAYIRTLLPGSKMTFTIHSLSPKGKSVVAHVVMHVNAVVADAKHPGKTTRAVWDGGWHDTWIRSKHAWRNKIGIEVPAK